MEQLIEVIRLNLMYWSWEMTFKLACVLALGALCLRPFVAFVAWCMVPWWRRKSQSNLMGYFQDAAESDQR
jgi:hypothetical protein